MSGTFGHDTPSIPFWEQEARRYAGHVHEERAAYHAGRLGTADRLLDRAELPAGARVVDFGCGDGVYSRALAARGFTVLGLDPAAAMIDLARENDQGGSVEFRVGGAADLAAAGPFDAVVSLNVLAYLTDEEMARFWAGLEAGLAPGGVLLVSHSNSRFDEFSPRRPDVPNYNVRADPDTYAGELAAHGLEQVAQAYFNFHPRPPAELGPGDAGRILDPDEIVALPLEQQQRQCSTLFALARRR
jgi:2-polyprenyl-3-methyl-5-hydroxy-6-metoxy-1,4-benzoquinol methylase